MFGLRSEKRMRRTLEEQRVRNFLHRSAVVRWLIVGALLAGLIGLSLLGGKYEPVDLTAGQISPRTMVARVNFSYLDESATSQERDRKARTSPNVYRLSLDDFQRNLLRTQHLLERVSSLKRSGGDNETRLKQIADIWNEGAALPLSPAELKSLIGISDKKGFLENLTRFSAKLADGGIVGDDQFSSMETPIAWGIHPEDVSTQLKFSRAGQFPTASQARQRLMAELSSAQPLSKPAIAVLERIMADLVTPNLQLDLPLSAKLQENNRKNVDPIYRNISKGSVLIERGERVTEDKLVMLKAYQQETERGSSSLSRWRQRIGTILLVAMILGMAVLVLEFQPLSGKEERNREYALLATIVVLHFAICRVAMYAADWMTLSPSLTSAILPSCFGPMLVSILLDRRRAHVAAFVSSFLLGLITQFSFAVMLTSLVSSVVGIHLLTPLRRRVRIYEAGLVAGIVAAAVMVEFGFMSDVPWSVMGQQGVFAVGAALVASFLISSLLPIFESVFKVSTDLRWLELADLNHPLLRRMVLESPGTYHHSLVVANLAERACEVIGAHALQARVCSYFHDIGKLNKPEYFCENQIGDENPHEDITPNMSALIIIAHVKDGVDMAIQHKMARPIVDTIQQHHGTSQVTFFYRLAKRNEKDAQEGSRIMRMNVSDVPRVEEETYRYPGPKPRTREIAIISLADAVEGASRCMFRPTPQKIESLIAEIVEERYRDGQLDDCPLSIAELKLVMESFSKTILSMLHTRVVYPKDESDVDQPAPFPSAAAD